MLVNAFELLGVGETSSRDEIHAAYKKKAYVWHPDRNGGKTDEAFLQLQLAHKILTQSPNRSELGGRKIFETDHFRRLQRKTKQIIQHIEHLKGRLVE